jgi:hypothetical protein
MVSPTIAALSTGPSAIVVTSAVTATPGSSIATGNTVGTSVSSGAVGGIAEGTVITVVATIAPTLPTQQSKSSNTGAIAGGVVGGLAVISLATLAGVLLCLRSRKKRHNAQAGVPDAATDHKQGLYSHQMGQMDPNRPASTAYSPGEIPVHSAQGQPGQPYYAELPTNATHPQQVSELQ